MFEANATQVVGYVRQDTQYQLVEVLKRYGITNFAYTEIQPLHPGQAVVSRFEFTIFDGPEVDPERIVSAFLRSATGYQPPDAQVVVTRVYAATNAM